MDAKVILEDSVASILDTIGLFKGCFVESEVVQLEVPGGEVRVLGSAFGGLELPYTEEDFNRVWVGAQFMRGLRLGLVDFRLALRLPQETAFLAYRGLEGLRVEIANLEGISNEATSWDRFREIAEITREEIDSIKKAADDRRHGKAVLVTSAQRQEALTLLQRALITLSLWCAENVPEVRKLLQDGSASTAEAGA